MPIPSMPHSSIHLPALCRCVKPWGKGVRPHAPHPTPNHWTPPLFQIHLLLLPLLLLLLLLLLHYTHHVRFLRQCANGKAITALPRKRLPATHPHTS